MFMEQKRTLSLLVDNTPGLLSRVAGLFSRRGYNIETITAGVTADPRYTRMTVVLYCSDEMILEQIKKQLNRMVEVIRVLDFTNVSVHMKEILYVKVLDCSPEDKTELFQIAETFKAQVIDYGKDSLLLEFFQTSGKNDSVVRLMKKEFHHIEVVRGGSVGIESISMTDR